MAAAPSFIHHSSFIIHHFDEWLLTAERVAIHRGSATAVVADLHLGYAEARRRGGEAVPAPRLADLLKPLRQAMGRHGVRKLVIAGDLFEAGHRAELARGLLDWLAGAGVELAGVVPGNHDRGLRPGKTALPVCEEAWVGGWRVVHGDAALPDGLVVQGHLHPCVYWRRGISAPCYLVGEGRLVLPAYCAEAAGANILGRPGWDRFRCHAIVGEEVLDFGEVGALTDARRGGLVP